MDNAAGLSVRVGSRLTVACDREAADAARHLRSWLATPGGADLCAGVPDLDIAAIERVATATARLHLALQDLLTVAKTPRQPHHTEATGLTER